MIKQFDIISVNHDDYFIVVSNNIVNQNSNTIWVMPINNEEQKYITDILLVTKENIIKGIIDTTQISHLIIEQSNYKVIDHAQPRIYKDIVDSIEAHIEIL
ncbi:type II toxin-antitoxin system PemK/MazF family toxin [Staphylococcus shinii]|uniref:type II toxin-antitoxin system PemK/MazF family toxin n=1 Tax=Staphylococcus shinii TaxID=2912228 RepID=UPI003EE917D6